MKMKRKNIFISVENHEQIPFDNVRVGVTATETLKNQKVGQIYRCMTSFKTLKI